jgi:YbgC/YbaW family acyl-CoA thioester hydrolase
MEPGNAVRTSRSVDWGETDAAGIVFFPNYFRWFDRATHDLFAALGYPITVMLREGFTVPLVEAGCRFTSPLVYATQIEIASRVLEVRSRTIRVEHQVETATAVAAVGHEVRIWTRIAGGAISAEPIPDNVRRLLSAGGT